jgi:hypothetical protein
MLAGVSKHRLRYAVPGLRWNQIRKPVKTNIGPVRKTETHTDDEGDRVVVPIYSRLEFLLGVLHSLRYIQIVKVDRPFLMSLQLYDQRSSEDAPSLNGCQW